MDIEQEKNNRQSKGHDNQQTLLSPFHILELSGPNDGNPGRQFDLFGNYPLGSLDITPDIGGLEIDINPGRSAGIFTFDSHSPLTDGDVGYLDQRYGVAHRRRHRHAL